jgi:two-component system, NarL family, sensor histidine kinase UhpB
VVIDRTSALVHVTIEDNGRGFDPVGAETRSYHGGERGLGLVGMRERVLLIGGSLEIESSAGDGTTIFVRIPLLNLKDVA